MRLPRTVLRLPVLPLATAVALAVPASLPHGTAGRSAGPAVRAAAVGERTVSYDGAVVHVPTSWPVVDLASDPTRCVRFDIHAVYLGTPGPAPDCPAHLVGRTDAVWLAPAAATSSPAARAGVDTAVVAGGRVRVLASYGARPATAQALVDDARASTAAAGGGTGAAPATPPVALAAHAVQSAATPETGAAVEAAAQTGVTAGASTAIGNGFDACSAPSEAVMKAWLASSPYRSVNIYIGGVNRACGQSYLTPTWVSDVTAMGWRLIPTYVGPQAPCTSIGTTMSSSPTTAQAQGASAADDAAATASALGLPTGAAIYDDVEAYSRSSSCSAAVLAFLRGWTTELHTRGWRAGAYGASGSLIPDLAGQWGTGYPEPDDVWIASWDGLDSVFGSSAVPDTEWTGHHRIHQWRGGHNESYGGYQLNIDSDAVDADVAGPPGGSCLRYPADSYGPDGCSGGFSLTGPLQYWRFGAPVGTAGDMRWTHGNGSSEADGATWRPALSAGGYQVSVWIPAANADATVTYSVSDAAGTHTVSVAQATHRGAWVTLGKFTATTSTGIRVHVGDAVATSSTVGVDAMRFVPLSPPDTTAPTGSVDTPAEGTFARPGAGVRLSGQFSDNVAVTGVTFWVRSLPSGSWTRAGTDGHDSTPGATSRYTVTWTESYPDATDVQVKAVAVDAAGNATTAVDPDTLTVDGTAPYAAVTVPRKWYRTSTPWRIAWAGGDSGSGVVAWDVRYQRSSPTGVVSSWAALSPAGGFPAGTLSTTYSRVQDGYQACFEVRAHDAAGNVSTWSRPDCTAQALDDAALAASGFARHTDTAYYRGTFSTTRGLGATLTLGSVSARDVAVFAHVCATCGQLRVRIGSTTVGTVSLVASQPHRHVWLVLPAFPRVAGRLTLTTTKADATVRVDAVAIGR